MQAHILHRKPASALSLTSFFPHQPNRFPCVPLTAVPIDLLIPLSTHREPVLFLPFSLLHLHLLAGLMVQGYAR